MDATPETKLSVTPQSILLLSISYQKTQAPLLRVNSCGVSGSDQLAGLRCSL